jgi:hypothetical protein
MMRPRRVLRPPGSDSMLFLSHHERAARRGSRRYVA